MSLIESLKSQKQSDNFQIEYKSPSLSDLERSLILSSGILIDIQYFERKANQGGY